MRRALIAGNWKMNGSLAANGRLLADLLSGASASGVADLAVCVPFPYLAQAELALSGSDIAWGGQDVSPHESGAYTGEVSAAMLSDFGCRYVIIGHSERRQFHGESDESVSAKAVRALSHGLTPIVCVGETLEAREAGHTNAVVARQLAPVVAALRDRLADIVVAYEPVWAIGTGRTATPDMAQGVHSHIRDLFAATDGQAAKAVRVLYGGSMKPDNAADLLAMPDIDGGLIGGASLKVAEFLAIARAASLNN